MVHGYRFTRTTLLQTLPVSPVLLLAFLISDKGLLKGRTIWLGAQVLSVYLHDLLGSMSRLKGQSRRERVLDVGAGTGLASLSLSSMGYDVLATDLDLIVDGVLKQNIEANETILKRNGFNQPRIERKVLDWFQDPKEWSWEVTEDPNHEGPLKPPFDLIVSADTIYDPTLSQPLLRTLHGLSSPLPHVRSSIPPVYLALEARDPALISAFLESAESDWNFKCSRVDHNKLKKLVEAKEGGLGWEDEVSWEGVEVWKLKLRKAVAKKER
jgi:SAM-dependent methyltransferase